MNEKLTSEQIIEKIINCNTHFEIEQIEAIRQILTALTAEDECNHVWYGRPSIGDTVCGKCGIQEAHTAEDECDWRDEKPKYTIRLYSNGRWQMEGK